MGTMKLSFRLLLALTCGVVPLLLAAAACGILTREVEVYDCEYDNTEERRESVKEKYRDLFESHPFYWGHGDENFMTEQTQTEKEGIVVRVTVDVPNKFLLPERRIPQCLDGIPVHVEEGGWFYGANWPVFERTQMMGIVRGGQVPFYINPYLRCHHIFYVGQYEATEGEETIGFNGERHMEVSGSFRDVDGDVLVLSNSLDVPKRVYVFSSCPENPERPLPTAIPQPRNQKS